MNRVSETLEMLAMDCASQEGIEFVEDFLECKLDLSESEWEALCQIPDRALEAKVVTAEEHETLTELVKPLAKTLPHERAMLIWIKGELTWCEENPDLFSPVA